MGAAGLSFVEIRVRGGEGEEERNTGISAPFWRGIPMSCIR